MSTSSIKALASIWARIAEEAELPSDYKDMTSLEVHRASEAIQERIREHIAATNDMRLFSLLHLLGQASLRMEQALWPEDYEHMTRKVEEASAGIGDGEVDAWIVQHPLGVVSLEHGGLSGEE